jgi:hypothetical protein
MEISECTYLIDRIYYRDCGDFIKIGNRLNVVDLGDIGVATSATQDFVS